MKPETATKIVIALIWGIITLFSPAMGLEEMTAVCQLKKGGGLYLKEKE